MKPTQRSIRKWTMRSLLAAAVLAVLYLGILFYPTPLFAYSERFGAFRVYADEPIPAGMPGVIEDLDRRLSAMEHGAPGGSHRIYLCGSPGRYAFFAFLTRRGAESLAIGLSLPNETFVSVTRVRLFAKANRGVLRHTRFEGNVAEVVAHEIAHFNSLYALGLRPHLAQPLWKSEGWAEYQANLAAIRADPGYDLHDRIDQLIDDGLWAEPAGFGRRMWEAQLLVEFLGEVKGYRLADLVREDVTQTFARDAMMDWHQGRRSGPSEGPVGYLFPRGTLEWR